ncbi:MAG: hypothetical protein J7576_15980 [Siphonobacter aquaeclarae]|nr:hypothetical protein [Siphonobacter aquaeclarae]
MKKRRLPVVSTWLNHRGGICRCDTLPLRNSRWLSYVETSVAKTSG